MFRSALLASLLLAALSLLAGNPPDSHFLAPSTSAAARQSVFIHGYLHGYEVGFHLADLDLQLGRGPRDLGQCKQARDPEGYRREFGNKHFFQLGYREGVRVGYADGISGRSFRAIRELQQVGGFSPASASPDPSFDRGFSSGYASGQSQGLTDARHDAVLNTPLPECPPLPRKTRNPRTFCAAYVSGYRFGYSDGFVNVAPRSRLEARAGK